MALPHDLCYSIVDIQHLLQYCDSYSSVLQYFSFVMSIVICLVGLVGNAVVIFCFVFIMKKHKSKYWFLNLAIADFLCLLILPLHAISTFKGTWTFGPLMCKLFSFSLCANMYASIYILIALNIARVLSVAQPMFHHKFISQRVSVWICSFVWLITMLITLPVFFCSGEIRIGEVTLCSFFGSTKTSSTAIANNVSNENTRRDILVTEMYTKLYPYIKQCSNDTCCGDEETLYLWNHLIFTSNRIVIPSLIMGYFIPLGIVIICNITIAVQVRKSKTVNTHRLYRTVLIIIMVFFLTWTPIVIAETAIFIAIHNTNLITLINVLIFMPLLSNVAYTNTCLNPIVYVMSGEQMRTRISEFISSVRDNYL